MYSMAGGTLRNDSTQRLFLSSSLIDTRDMFRSCRSLWNGLGEGLQFRETWPMTLRFRLRLAMTSIDSLSRSFSDVSDRASMSWSPLVMGANLQRIGVGQKYNFFSYFLFEKGWFLMFTNLFLWVRGWGLRVPLSSHCLIHLSDVSPCPLSSYCVK